MGPREGLGPQDATGRGRRREVFAFEGKFLPPRGGNICSLTRQKLPRRHR